MEPWIVVAASMAVVAAVDLYPRQPRAAAAIVLLSPLFGWALWTVHTS